MPSVLKVLLCKHGVLSKSENGRQGDDDSEENAEINKGVIICS